MSARPDPAFRFKVQIPVRWVDIDSVGVLNNAVYLTFFEQARFEYFGRLGLLEDGQFPFVLGETTVRYLRPGRAGRHVEVSLRTTRIGGASFEQVYEVRQGEEILCTGRATLVYVDAALRSRRVPDPVRDALATFEGGDLQT